MSLLFAVQGSIFRVVVFFVHMCKMILWIYLHHDSSPSTGYAVQQLQWDTFAIGAPRYQHLGSVFIYMNNSTTSEWSQVAAFTADKVTEGCMSGRAKGWRSNGLQIVKIFLGMDGKGATSLIFGKTFMKRTSENSLQSSTYAICLLRLGRTSGRC